MKVLITGPDGQIGWELLRALPPDLHTVPLSIAELDLTNPPAIRDQLRQHKPNLIINAAGYTAVDRAEVEPGLTHAVNATAVGILGEEAKRLGAAVVHLSTDYIFDGSKRTPYTSDDLPNPLSVYGQSKLDGEIALVSSGASHLIIRTSWVYGLRGRNFLLAMLQQAAVKPELRVVNDQTGCPTSAPAIAHATTKLIFRTLHDGPSGCSFGNHGGIYHLACGGFTTWYDFARRIFELADIASPPLLRAITSAEYGAPAKRPQYSVLDCAKARERFNVVMPHWEIALQELLSAEKPIPARAAAPSGESR